MASPRPCLVADLKETQPIDCSSDQMSTSAITRDVSVRKHYFSKRVLVTGADGFLGYNCVRTLHELGADIGILTRRAPSRSAVFAREVHYGDLANRDVTKKAVKGRSIVFDFAGTGGAIASNTSPGDHQRTECPGQLNLFECCADASARVMFCSTRLVYGRPEYLPVDENHPLCPQSFYAIHKVTVEMYLRVLSQERGLRYSVLRLSNPYGPFQNTGGPGVINNLIRSACAGQEIVVYGDGQQQRDYIYVDDVISAFLLAAMNDDCQGMALNLGGLEPTSLASAARLIAELAGSPGVRFVPWPDRDFRVETGDYRTDLSELLRRISMPEQTGLVDGLRRSVDHYRNEVASTTAAPTPETQQFLVERQHA